MDPFFSTAEPLTSLSIFALFMALMIGHCLADFPLQGEYLALFKNRHYPGSDKAIKREFVWPYVLSAHALIHMGMVWLITGSFIIGLLEFVLHWVIDFSKCEGWTNYHIDQALHCICKIAYLGIILAWGQHLV